MNRGDLRNRVLSLAPGSALVLTLPADPLIRRAAAKRISDTAHAALGKGRASVRTTGTTIVVHRLAPSTQH